MNNSAVIWRTRDTQVLPHGEWVLLHLRCVSHVLVAVRHSANMANELLQLFTSIGLSEQKAKETLKNQNVSENLKQVINEVG